ncbi:MAG: NAD(P)-dependent oxidoreductase [Armatimonadetes bacterium]|nr:NAD(P)-dependent oxidoreductase [Armatimonadota bacterium]
MVEVQKVLITGAAGYLARFVIDRLRLRCDLTLLDRLEPEVEGVRFIRGDVTFFPDVEAACEGQDAVVHLAALVRDRFDKPPWMMADVMVKGTWNIVEGCALHKVRRLVNVSSVVACGWPLSSDRPYRVGDPSSFPPGDLSYALAKRLGEEIGHAYHQAHGLSVIHLRCGVLDGDGLNAGPKAPEHWFKPWFVYADPRDAAQAVERGLETDIPYGCYHIVAGREDALFDWKPAAEELGYRPEYNWPDIPEIKEG